MDFSKPFVGVIGIWKIVDGCVEGKCLWHQKGVKLSIASGADPIVIGLGMHTSKVIDRFDYAHFSLIETENSLYTLIGKEVTP